MMNLRSNYIMQNYVQVYIKHLHCASKTISDFSIKTLCILNHMYQYTSKYYTLSVLFIITKWNNSKYVKGSPI